jgi:hypothetical protein
MPKYFVTGHNETGTQVLVIFFSMSSTSPIRVFLHCLGSGVADAFLIFHSPLFCVSVSLLLILSRMFLTPLSLL